MAGQSGRKTKELAEIFQVAEPTIRTWSGEFEQFLSPDANPGEGRTRYYSEEDVRVLALVAEMKGQGKQVEDIAASLSIGKRGDVESAVQAAQQRPQSLDQAIVYIEQLVSRVESLQEQVSAQANEITQWRDEANQLKGQLAAIRDKEERDAERGTDSQARIIELERTIAVLEYQLSQANRGGQA